MGSVTVFVSKNVVVLFLLRFWCSFSARVIMVSGFLSDLFSRLQGMVASPKCDPNGVEREEADDDVDHDLDYLDASEVSDPDCVKKEPAAEDFHPEFGDFNGEVIKEEKEEVTESVLSFRFPRYEEMFGKIECDGGTDEISEEEKPDDEVIPYEDRSRIRVETPVSVGDMNENRVRDDDAEGVSLNEGLHESASERTDQFGEDIAVSSDSDCDDTGSSDKFSIRSSLLHASRDSFMFGSDSEFGTLSGFDEENDDELSEALHNLEDGYVTDDMAEDQEILREQIKSQTCDETLDSESDSDLDGTKLETNLKNSIDSDAEDSSPLETLWEHQELVDQLNMEIRKVRAFGLPTIFEDSDMTKMAMDDLKPWKIEDKFQKVQYHGTILEIHKFYKSYRERMRKFDIFNYQKTYTIDFLGLKKPLERLSINKSSAGSLGAVMWQECWPCKPKVSEQPSPVTQFSRELDCDLEVVYVGQLCLSWEFLHWEYGKALELWDSDSHGFLQYNEVAGEFQRFQVLLQRFIEEEPYKGTRVQSYVKTRRHQQHLLQVPVIRGC